MASSQHVLALLCQQLRVFYRSKYSPGLLAGSILTTPMAHLQVVLLTLLCQVALKLPCLRRLCPLLMSPEHQVGSPKSIVYSVDLSIF